MHTTFFSHFQEITEFLMLLFSLYGQINVVHRKATKYEKFRRDWIYDKRLVELGISQSGEKEAERRHDSF